MERIPDLPDNAIGLSATGTVEGEDYGRVRRGPRLRQRRAGGRQVLDRGVA